jgi:hypothetical protein
MGEGRFLPSRKRLGYGNARKLGYGNARKRLGYTMRNLPSGDSPGDFKSPGEWTPTCMVKGNFRLPGVLSHLKPVDSPKFLTFIFTKLFLHLHP